MGSILKNAETRNTRANVLVRQGYSPISIGETFVSDVIWRLRHRKMRCSARGVYPSIAAPPMSAMLLTAVGKQASRDFACE